MPPITVLLPVYNAGPHLANAIESMLCQSFADFEMIIINDGSTDGSGNVIAGYHDPRIVALTNHRNIGLIGTLNRGISTSKGEFIARMDQDDMSRPDRLDLQYRHLVENPRESFCCSWYEVIQRGRPPRVARMPAAGQELRAELMFGNIVAHSTVMMRRSALDRAGGGYDPDYRYCEDYELWLRLSREGDIGVVPEVLLTYRVLPGSESRAQPQDLRRNVERLMARILRDAGVAGEPEELRCHSALSFRDSLAGDRQAAQHVARWINRLLEFSERTDNPALKRVVINRATGFLERQVLRTALCAARELRRDVRLQVVRRALPLVLISSLPAGMRESLKAGIFACRR